MKISVIIPAHNEASTIGILVKGVRDLGFDCAVIDDGSQDDTGRIAEAAGARVLKTPAKSGKGSALKMGFEFCVQSGYEAAMAMDGDGQHAPSDINAFVSCARQTGADIVCGNRMRQPDGMPVIRLVTNHFMSWLISMFCRQAIPDTQCGFRLIKTAVLKSIKLSSADFEIETEVLIRAAKKGFRIRSVDIQTIYRNEVSKIQPVRDTFRFVAYLVRELASKND